MFRRNRSRYAITEFANLHPGEVLLEEFLIPMNISQNRIEGIQRGLEDVWAGRVVPHDEAMREIRAAIAKTAKTPQPR